VAACIDDADSGVRDDARNALEQLQNPALLSRLQNDWA